MRKTSPDGYTEISTSTAAQNKQAGRNRKEITMTSQGILCVVFSLGMLCIVAQSSRGQDSSAVNTAKNFSSFGLQASTVSGIGLTFRRTMNNRLRTGMTAGLIKTEGETIFSTGWDFHYELSDRPDIHIFVGPSLGLFGGSARALRVRIGFATGLEVPISGKELYENISAGAVLYYPTYFLLSETVGFAVGVFLLYNF